MAKMQLKTARRTKVSPTHFAIVGVRATNGEEIQLTTLVEKTIQPAEYRKVGGKVIPVEQYAFKVGTKVVDRFADAAALVMKRHNIEIVDGAEIPAYLAKAVAINAGVEA